MHNTGYPIDEKIALNKCKLPKPIEGYVFIYELIDPIDFKPKYIGCTDGPRKRYIQHLNVDRGKGLNRFTKKKNWIRLLLKNNLYPLINIIDVVPESEWNFWEEFWEDTYRGWGFELKNSVKCGYGTRGFKMPPPTKEQIQKRAATLKEGYVSGRIISPMKGIPKTEEQKENLRKNNYFYNKLTPEERTAQSKRNNALVKSRGYKRTPEQLERMLKGQLKEFINRPDSNYRCILKSNEQKEIIDKFLTLGEGCKSLEQTKKHCPANIRNAIISKKKYFEYFWDYGDFEQTKELLKEKGYDDLIQFLK